MTGHTRIEKKLWERRWMAAVFAALLLSTLALVLTPRPAEAGCPIDQTCTANHFPPDVSVDNSTVTVNEGQVATNSGTYDDTLDDDADIVSISAIGANGQTLGSVSGGGAEAGTWNWQYHTTDGPSQSQTVTVTARDTTGRSSSTTFNLVVNNVAPSEAFNAPTSVNEGSSIGLSLNNPTDPSSADTSAGFMYAFSCNDTFESQMGIFGIWTYYWQTHYSDFSTSSSYSCGTNDNGTRTVRGAIRDKDGGITNSQPTSCSSITCPDGTNNPAYTGYVTINNVAPQATFVAPDFVKAGSMFPLSLTNPTDPSSADMAAGFNYAFDCGSGYGAFGTASSDNCTAPTTPTQLTVKGQIRDKDSGTTERTYGVAVDGAHPSGSVTINGGKLRTTSRKVTLSLSATDPAPASGVASMRFSNNGKTWSAWEAYATNKAWTLSKGTGTKTVFVQYKDNVGFVSAKAKDTIVYRP